MNERCYDQWNLDTLPEIVLYHISSFLEEANLRRGGHSCYRTQVRENLFTLLAHFRCQHPTGRNSKY